MNFRLFKVPVLSLLKWDASKYKSMKWREKLLRKKVKNECLVSREVKYECEIKAIKENYDFQNKTAVNGYVLILFYEV
jgi:hypothetical protein